MHKRILYLFLVFGLLLPAASDVQGIAAIPANDPAFNGLNNRVIDSTLLQITKSTGSLLTLNTDGYLTTNRQIYLRLQTTGDEEAYNLWVKAKDRVVFSREGIKRISKVFVDKDHMLFTVYTFFSEDGANEGEAILINTQSMNSQAFKQPLINTCNPVFYSGSYYFIDGLCLTQADTELRILKSFPLIYKSDRQRNEYLDTYLVCGLSKNETDQVIADRFYTRKV